MDQLLVYLTAALKLAPTVIAAGQDLAGLAAQVLPVVQSGNAPSDADWAALTAYEDQLRAQLNAPAGSNPADGAQ